MCFVFQSFVLNTASVATFTEGNTPPSVFSCALVKASPPMDMGNTVQTQTADVHINDQVLMQTYAH